MRVVWTVLMTLALVSSAACQKKSSQDQNVVIDNDAATPTDVEALPADESSATPTNELQNGADNAEVNDLGNESNSH